jgi:PBP1b-binding outer membrane lipoprotein LpoB
MKNILNFLDKWGMRISTLLILIVFLKTCSTNGRIDKVQDNLEVTNSKVDTLAIELRKEMKIEGLKSEKRMIQATDRKMLDVQRQTQIETEINKLEKQ